MLAWDPYECEKGDVLWSECYIAGIVRQGATKYKKVLDRMDRIFQDLQVGAGLSCKS